MPTALAHSMGGKAKAAKIRAEYNRNPRKCKGCPALIMCEPERSLSHIRAKQFCTRSCAGRFNNRIPKRFKEGLCVCGEPCRKAFKLCDKCQFVKSYINSIEHKMKGEVPRGQVYEHSRRILKEVDKKCERCRYDGFVEVCHIKPVREFPDTALLSEINASENLAILCPNCHWEFDHGMLQLEVFRSVSLSSTATQA